MRLGGRPTTAGPRAASPTWRAFSFHGRKGITSGEGGALVGDDDDLMARARKLHTYGIAPAVSREGAALAVPSFDDAGFNYRMSDVQAAIMRVQLERLPELLAARRAAADGYAERLDGLDGITLPVALADRTHPWQSYLVTTDDSVDRDAVVVALRERGVGSNFGTYASHVQPVYGSTQHCPVSLRLFEQQLALPMHANLVDDDLDYVAEQLRRDPQVVRGPEGRPVTSSSDNDIHPTAVVGPQVEIGEGNVIGPFCVLQGPVRLGDGNFFSSHVSVGGAAEVHGHLFVPSWREESEEGGVVIGSRNVFKEFVTVNTGWQQQTRHRRRRHVHGQDALRPRRRSATTASRSPARALIGGHTVLEDDTTVGLGAALHQRCVIGAGAMIGMQAAVTRDVPPYAVSMGAPAKSSRLNTYRLDKLGVAARVATPRSTRS